MDIDVSQSNLMLAYGKYEKEKQVGFNVSFCMSLMCAFYRCIILFKLQYHSHIN